MPSRVRSIICISNSVHFYSYAPYALRRGYRRKGLPSTSSGSSIGAIVRFARTAWEGVASRLVVKSLVRTLCEELARPLGDTRCAPSPPLERARAQSSHNAVGSSRFVEAVAPFVGSTGRASGGTIISCNLLVLSSRSNRRLAVRTSSSFEFGFTMMQCRFQTMSDTIGREAHASSEKPRFRAGALVGEESSGITRCLCAACC
jgi:hypothetical protein